jgi:hypothetical protein
MIKGSRAPLGNYLKALREVAVLQERVRWNMDLEGKLIGGLRFLAGIPAAALPQGQLLLAASYIGLETYVILAGGDAVDAPRLDLFDHTPGVPGIVKADLELT